MPERIAIFVWGLSCALLSGCQLLLELKEVQCEQDADCVGLLGTEFVCSDETFVCEREEVVDSGPPPLPEEWSCLRENLPTAETVPEPPSADATVELSLAIIEYTTRNIPEGLMGQACLASDIDCANPVDGPVAGDEEGYLTFTVPFGFDGRLEIEADGRLPTVFYINRPVTSDYKAFGTALISQEELESIASRSDDALKPDRGVVLFGFQDCHEEAAPGVVVVRTDDADDNRFYFDGSLPDQDLEASRISRNLSNDGTPAAAGGFFNAKPGFVNYEVRLAATDDLVGTASVEVKANHMTMVLLFPGDY